MDSPEALLRRYEQATNEHTFTRLAPLIANDAVYWFIDGSHRARAEIEAAISHTFATIRDEVYETTTWSGSRSPRSRRSAATVSAGPASSTDSRPPARAAAPTS
jgi:hypothetical protein